MSDFNNDIHTNDMHHTLRVSASMTFNVASPIQMITENIKQAASHGHLKTSLTSTSGFSLDDIQSESRSLTNFRSLKVLSANDLLNCETMFYKTGDSKSEMSLNENGVDSLGIYTSDDFLDKTRKIVYGDVDFNSIKNENKTSKSAVYQFKHLIKTPNISQSTSTAFLFKERYFKRMKSKRKSTSSYIYGRKFSSSKNILNQIEALQSHNGLVFEFFK